MLARMHIKWMVQTCRKGFVLSGTTFEFVMLRKLEPIPSGKWVTQNAELNDFIGAYAFVLLVFIALVKPWQSDTLGMVRPISS